MRDRQKIVGQAVDSLSAGTVQTWRQQLTQGVLRALAALGALVLVAGSYASYLRGLGWTIPVYVGAYALLVLVAFWRRVPYILQVGSLLGVLYGIGVFSLVASGLGGNGVVFFLALAALAVLLMGWQWGVFVLALCVVTVATLGGFFSSGLLVVSTERLVGINAAWSSWISRALLLLMMGALLGLCQSYMFRRLLAALAESQELTWRLGAEIAERARAEGALLERTFALRREHDLVARMMDTSPVGITMVDREGRITFANSRAEKVLGLTKDKITQRAYNAPEWRITDYDGGPFPDEALPFSQVIHTGQPVYDVRHAIEWPNGCRVLLSINAAPLLDEAGRVDGMVATIEDVTVQVQTEQALRESETKSRNIIESIPMGMHMYQLEPDGKLVFTGANPAASEILGVDHGQFVGKTIEEAFPALVETEVPESYRWVATQGGIWQTDQIIYEEGQISGAFEVRAFQTSPGRMVATFLDVAERVRAEEVRRRAEAEILRLQHLLQNITDSMPSALVTLALDGRVLTWNPAAEVLTGRDAAEVKGQLLWQACPELVRYRGLFEQVVRERQVAHRHRERLTAQMGISYRDVDVFPLVTNNIEGVVLRIDDVTRWVQIEEMMLQSAKMASVGGLAAGVAHEINNPLGAMMQSAQMLQVALDVSRPRTLERLRAYEIEPDGLGRYLQERGLLEYLQGIRDMGARAAKIVTDLLSFSRKQPSDAAPHDLNGLVEQTLDLAVADYDLRKKYDFREIEIVREMASGLPQVLCDGQQIQQVVLNLVRNAAQAMAEKAEREGLYRPQLILRTGCREGWVRLEVEDNGPGISEEVRERLFEPFFTTKGVGEGTGLGLWLCWSIVVERHKGQIWAEAGEDTGARFVVELPVAQLMGVIG